jgi:hypothetical protein
MWIGDSIGILLYLSLLSACKGHNFGSKSMFESTNLEKVLYTKGLFG